MTGVLEYLKWESLKKRRRDSRLILLYKGLKGKASIPTDDLIPLVRRCRNDHSMAYQVPIANTDIYTCSFSPRPLGIGMHFQTLLSPLLKVPRMVLLSSLLWWELGTNLPGHGPGEWLSFWRVTNKYFWFWFWIRQVRSHHGKIYVGFGILITRLQIPAQDLSILLSCRCDEDCQTTPRYFVLSWSSRVWPFSQFSQ